MWKSWPQNLVWYCPANQKKTWQIMAMIMAIHIAMAALAQFPSSARSLQHWGCQGRSRDDPDAEDMWGLNRSPWPPRWNIDQHVWSFNAIVWSPAQRNAPMIRLTHFLMSNISAISGLFLMTWSFHTWTSQHVVTTHDAALYSVHLSSNQRNITSHELLRNMARGRGRGITTFFKE
jgi:hypothetical protein